jgi:hypothetical protein
MGRYKSIQIKNFNTGVGLNADEKENPRIEASRLRYDHVEKTISLKKTWFYTTVDGTVITNQGNKTFCVANNYYHFLLVQASDGDVELYRAGNTSAYSLIHTFSLGEGSDQIDAFGLFYFNNKLVAMISQPDHVEEVFFTYSSDNGSTWSSPVASAYPNDWPISIKITDKKVYILSDMNRIFESSDGYTFTLFFSNTDGESLDQIEIFNNELYYSADFAGGLSASFGIFENSVKKRIATFQKDRDAWLSLLNFDEDFILLSVVSDLILEIYKYDFEETSLLAKIDDQEYTTAEILCQNKHSAFLAASDSTYDDEKRILIEVTKNGGVFINETLASDKDIRGGYVVGRYLYLVYYDTDSDTVTRYRSNEDKYTSFSTYARIGPVEIGEHVPVALIINFKKGISKTIEDDVLGQYEPNIRISVEFDDNIVTSDYVDAGAETYARGLVLDPADPEYYSMYTMSVVKKITDSAKKYCRSRFVFFRVYLDASEDQTKTPYLKSIKYIYEPVGLENAI